MSINDIGRLVREARQAAGVTQQSLADQAGTTRQWIIRLEQGQRTVTMGVVLDVLMVLGLELVAELHANSAIESGSRWSAGRENWRLSSPASLILGNRWGSTSTLT